MGKSKSLPLLAFLSFVVVSCSNTSGFSSSVFSSKHGSSFESNSSLSSNDSSLGLSSGSQNSSQSSIPPIYNFDDPEDCEPANGAYSYIKASSEEKNKLVASLEKWATDNKLTGLTLYEDEYGSITKFNMNTCTTDRWQELFGENGSICQTPSDQQWKVEPAMSNKNFLDGLSYAIDRETLAAINNKIPTANFFPSTFTSEPDGDVYYNTTGEHFAAVKSIQEGTSYGFSLEKAKNSFLIASQELITNGIYKDGDVIEIEIALTTNDLISTLFNPIKAMLEAAFNTDGNPLKLKVTSWVGQEWSAVFFDKMQKGQFDIGYGSIGGGAYHYYERLEYLRSDNERGFTINWGADTSKMDRTLTYDKKIWSYNALLEALENGVYSLNGEEESMFDVRSCEVLLKEDGSLVISIVPLLVSIDDKTWAKLASVVLYGLGEKDNVETYSEITIDLYKDDGSLNDGVEYNSLSNCFTVTIDAEIMTDWFNRYPQDTVYAQGIDAHFDTSIFGVTKREYLFNVWEGTLEKNNP